MPLIRKDTTPVAQSPAKDLPGALTSANGEERWSAARALAKVAGSEAALGDALARETDPRVREAIFTSLAHLRTAAAVEVILPRIRSADASVRTGALDALSTMPDAVSGYLPTLLADPDGDVRLLVCEVVRRLPGSAATQTLCALLETETAPNVCAAAIDALSEVGDPSALPVLARCADRFADEPFLVFAVKIASDRIGGIGRVDSPTAP
jgi:HEAT repeat protein